MTPVQMKRRVKQFQRELGQLGPVMRGSPVVIGTKYKQSYYSVGKKGKTQLIYLGRGSPRDQLARQYAANYKRLRAIVEEMTELNMMLLKDNEL